MRSLIVHGHFYQPPRENPWTGFVNEEPSAAPFSDWNERIYHECYRPNGAARVLDSRGRVRGLVDNYASLSWNFGPTLLSWLERAHPRAYANLIAGDVASRALRGGHGNGIAQGYNHTILPLANARDRRTQVRWGLADFRHRFGREPESLWLPETACNDAVLEELVAHGMRFVLLAPSQAKRVRRIGDELWTDAPHVDTSMPYLWRSKLHPSRSIAVFFYDGALSRAIAFEKLLTSSERLIETFSRSHASLVHVATDGETYGHHFANGDRTLAYALDSLASKFGFRVTNYGEELDRLTPSHEVELDEGPLGEGTSWSCAHGVGRWIRDCGCHTGGREGWNQAWRGPLRSALEALRDEADAFYESAAHDLVNDAWAARDASIELELKGAVARSGFLSTHSKRALSSHEETRLDALLAMQRHVQLASTSCGWFFSDPSGLETLQLLRYAECALDWMDRAGGAPKRDEFLARLAEVRSNLPEEGNAADLVLNHIAETRATSVHALLGIGDLLSSLRNAYEAYRLAQHFDADIEKATARARLQEELIRYLTSHPEHVETLREFAGDLDLSPELLAELSS